MSRTKVLGYTLAQHSGFARGRKGDFRNAVEHVSITTQEDLKRVKKAGGIVVDTYEEAEQAEMAANYPPGVKGLIPQCKGTFASAVIDGLRIYVPPPEGQ
jgi:hypothetical protein